ncbi:hypothetical protein [Prosthecobacter sp.]|jgi:hypothetical protein|uniref:hypothetical protein n=1 Tax=Prosthecobacter sp. TaxID=1965333 RepID=UPI0037C6DCB5
MPLTDQEAREELRYAVRRYLAARPQAALTLDMIRHGLRLKGINVEEADLSAALTFWMNDTPAQVMGHKRKHSSIESYQISTAGIVADERGE